MQTLIDIVVHNAIGVLPLALLATLVGRWVRRPELRHTLWLVVLLRLLLPVAVALPLLPPAPSLPWLAWEEAPSPAAEAHNSSAAGPAGTTAPPRPADMRPEPHWEMRTSAHPPNLEPLASATASAASTASSPASTGSPEQRPGRSLLRWFLMVALAGSLALALLSLDRIRQLRALLRTRMPAPEAVEADVRHLAERLGLRRIPPVEVVARDISPLLWLGRSGARILLPEALLSRLQPAELQAVLAHELAHAQRRDPWLRPLELAATLLFWWHPVLWWARRELHRAEELACDALVTSALPGQAKPYARGLLKTLELLAEPRFARSPALTTGALARHDLEERLTMILTRKTPPLLSSAQRWLLMPLAVLLLAVVPTWAGAPEDGATENEAQEVELEQQDRELERLEREKARELEEARAREYEAVRGQEAAAEAAHREAMQRELERARRQHEEHERRALEQHRKATERQRELRHRELEGHERQAEALQRQAERLEREHARRHRQEQERHSEAVRRQMRELERLQADELRQHELMVKAEGMRLESIVKRLEEAAERQVDEETRAAIRSEQRQVKAQLEALYSDRRVRRPSYEVQQRLLAAKELELRRRLEDAPLRSKRDGRFGVRGHRSGIREEPRFQDRLDPVTAAQRDLLQAAVKTRIEHLRAQQDKARAKRGQAETAAALGAEIDDLQALAREMFGTESETSEDYGQL